MANRETLAKLLAETRARYESMTPEEREAMHDAQRQSWMRAMQPCEHGVPDWEECEDCRRNHARSDPGGRR